MADNTIRLRATLEDKVSTNLERIRGQFDKSFGKTSSAVTFGALGAKAIEKGFGIVDSAVSGVISVLGDARQAYQEDQKSQSQLYTSLAANAKGWDGNKAAIEDVLTAREKLGFSDDEQRASLATLVSRTHDVNQALAIQSTAMDLARFKGMSLEDATNLLGKAYSGQVGALRKAGIAVDAHATSEEALLAVQKAVAGQAEAYSRTSAGQEAAANLKVQESMEKLGAVVDRVASAVLPGLADALSTIVEAAASVIGVFLDAAGAVGDFAKSANDFLGSIPGPWHHEMSQMEKDAQAVSAALVEQSKSTQAMADDSRESAKIAGVAMDSLARKSGASSDGIVEDQRQIRLATGRTADAVVKSLQKVVDAYNGMFDADKKAKTEIPKLEAALAKAHGVEAERIKAEIALLKAEVIAAHRALYALQSLPANNHPDPNNRNARASGGPVFAGQTYTVGENAPETLVMNAGGGGYVLPTAPARGGSTGGGVVINLTYAPTMSTQADQQRFSRTIVPELVREMRRQSVI